MAESNKNNKKYNSLGMQPVQEGSVDCGCSDSECCTPEPSKLKTIIFLVIILAALSVTTYSIFFNQSVADQSTEVTTIPPAFTDATLGEADFLYLVLEGGGSAEENNKIAIDLVNQVVQSLEEQKKNVVAASVAPGNELFSAAVDMFKITELPAVVVAKKGMPPALLAGPFDETNLLKAYVTGGCAPGTACCPDPSASGCAK